MRRILKASLVAAGFLSALAAPVAAAPVADVYANSGAWTVESWSEGPDARMCSARIANPSAQPDFGSYLRLENDGRQWTLASDYLISGNSVQVSLLIDGTAFPVQFSLDGDVVRAPVDQGVIDAIVAGRQIKLNFDPSGQNFSLRGAKAALDLATECVRGHGLQNAGNAGTNDYDGYDIAGTPQAVESHYAEVRGWTVTGATVAGNFAYCTGEFPDRGSVWRLGWDGMQWQVALPVENAPDWSGQIIVDGNSRSISGSARNGWTFAWLGMAELDAIRSGKAMLVTIGRTASDHKLVGTAAVISKIEECVARKGQGGSAAAAPRPASGGAPGCPDDGPRLPLTGICAGRAVAYLSGEATYGDYLPDPACEWVVNEVQVVEDALLYRALRCKGVTAQLEFAGGAQWAQLMIVRSALNAVYGQKPEVSDPQPLVWFNTIDPKHVERDLDMRSRQGAEQSELRGRKCAVKKADPSLSPDGYVFDITPADPRYKESREGPTGPQCGSFSYGDGAVRFWRVLGDYAFLFDLTPDLYQDIDPNTLTLLRKDSSGTWAAVQ
ncbi:hypothetical protein [Zavarzinia compransoris]|uniref:hypothetical protein n=1 Tax=Zavarzinia compransoris TaxID=1264899 RepID=UPI0010EC4605|nr:hypothetical protein [Zavarzinia compransoris]TDP46200.1 hypothetical protein DES42_104286 [Zavarzinia compransoris]